MRDICREWSDVILPAWEKKIGQFLQESDVILPAWEKIIARYLQRVEWPNFTCMRENNCAISAGEWRNFTCMRVSFRCPPCWPHSGYLPYVEAVFQLIIAVILLTNTRIPLYIKNCGKYLKIVRVLLLFFWAVSWFFFVTLLTDSWIWIRAILLTVCF